MLKTNRIQGEFCVYDLFTIETPKLRINANTVTVHDEPKGHPYVVRTSQNNGIRGYIEFDEQYLNPANTISFGQDTATMFYQERQYFTGDKIKILTLKCDKLNYRTATYLLASMRKAFSLFSWGQSKFTVNAIGEVKIYLPILCESEKKKTYNLDDIDWNYMQDCIRQLEQKRMKELERYLIATNLISCELTDEESSLFDNSGTQIRKDFSFDYIFKAQTGDVDLQQKDINGKGCYFINSGLENDGIKGKTDRLARVFPKNTITVDFWGNAFYRPFEYKLATHNHVFSLSGEIIKNELVGLYLVSQMMYLRKMFSYAEMGTWNKMKSLYISLPIITDKNKKPVLDSEHKYHPDGYLPDFDYMEKYIRAIQKKVVADVVKYKNQVIAHTQEVLCE